MCDDGIEEMVEESHSYFNENSIHEIIDMDIIDSNLFIHYLLNQ